jgi:glucosamine--fructose-6-phosphate aminotransferase (isomerizing)
MMRAGAEATVSSKTYLAMEMIMPWLAGVLLGKPVEPTLRDLALAPQLVAAYLQGWEQHVAWFAGALTGARCLYYAGRGPSLAAANTAGLITKESAHFPAEGLSSAAFRHGPIEMAQPGTSVVIFAGEPATRPLNLRLAGDIRRAGGSALLVSEDSPEDALRLPTAPAILRPILEILPVQMITLALAQLAGHSPGSFRHATKVTSEE